MKKLFYLLYTLLFLIVFSVNTYSQDQFTKSIPKNKSQDDKIEAEHLILIKKMKKSGSKLTDFTVTINNVTYPVWTNKNKYYVRRVSQDGNEYNYYLDNPKSN